MELLLVVVIGAVAGAIYYATRDPKKLDVNADGKVDAKDVVAAVAVVKEEVKAVADVNADGKVDVADAKAAKAAVAKTVKTKKVAAKKAAATRAKKKSA